MKTGPKGLALVKEFEGLRLKAYRCPAGIWTIGYGSTGKAVHEGLTITAEQAEEWLKRDLARFEKRVSVLVIVPLNQSQFDALVSFDFNTGALGRSTLLRLLNRGEYETVPAELAKWTRGGGKVLPGLVRRRAAEAALFTSKPEKATA